MSKRNTPQRRHNILALLNEQGEVSVDELAKRFETSEVTIRKDLAGSIEENIVHGSDAAATAAFETAYFFSALEIPPR